MKLITSAADLQAATTQAKSQQLTIGLVPTMGALHQGHLSLVERALTENQMAVVSIFVNPIQFNNQDDLARYPRTLEADLQLLADLEHRLSTLAPTVQLLVFTPTVKEIYPDGTPTEVYHFGPIEQVMEGPQRPGHFSGVATVVRRLFDLAQPTRAYFGEKDFQQIAIIRSLLDQIHYPIELIPCPIVRADDGLALSSRNARLSPAARALAPAIYATLQQATEMAAYEEVDDLRQWVLDTLASYHLINPQPDGLCFQPEYFDIVDALTLQPIASWDEASAHGAVGCIAVWLDGVRLIDMVKFTD